MLKRLGISGLIKFLSFLIYSLLVIILISSFIMLNNLSVSFKTNSSEKSILSVVNELEFFKYYLLLEILFGLAIILLLTFLLKKAFNKKSSNEVEKNEIFLLQQKEIEKQNKLINNLTNLYNDAVEYDRQKTEFFSNISHELKTPLSVILGAIQLIDHKNSISLDEQKNSGKHLKTIRQNSYRLVRLINNILDITKVDSGYIKINMINCNIVYLLEEITQSVAPYAEQKNLDLEFDTEFEEIITAVDVDKMERIILNLLSNAIKFTAPGGKVSVNISTINDKIIISVKDNGLGIPIEMKDAIFERFKQVNSSLTREFEGSGIGLSIVKSFVELHNGCITVKSEENKGSEFIIEMPIKTFETNTKDESISQSRQNKIIQAINIEFSDIYSFAS